eukprot:Unigene5684_Nuclearia_a/m.17350 Unigene5684_Nuclearia_a/g.17350  ORF Unigene5684_Nuclearia_a/g.17350 Unigene5684_Nuclearia_a/m.17350 type:complete len:240 (-) Unigene5684_Nuclearia_a:64-783(-)
MAADRARGRSCRSQARRRMAPMRRVWLALCAALVAAVATAPRAADALHFYLEHGAQRCFTEMLPKGTLVVANYRALVEDNGVYVENNEVGVLVNVMDMTNRNYLLKLKKDHAGRFTFTATYAGDHEICIRTNQTAWFRSAQKAKMYFDMTVGEGAHDINEQRERLSSLALQIRDLNNRVVDIRREQQYQKEQEEVFRDLSEAVNSRVVWFVLLQVVVMLVVTLWQLRHLTRFFAEKKVT